MAINHSQLPRRNRPQAHSQPPRADIACSVAEMKARQVAKIRQLGEALTAAGIVALDKQAKALGLPRSTTWTILKGYHKGSGLSAAVIKRMLAAPKLPSQVRAIILEYIEQKRCGLYGDCKLRIHKFSSRLSAPRTQSSPRARPRDRQKIA